MNVEEIFEKIEKNRENTNTHWSEKKIQLPDNGEIFKVNGFGICEDDNFEKGSFRYYLEFDINSIKNNKSLVVLLMNPSDKTNPKKQNIDNTIKNALKIGFSMNYSKVIILNSFAKICGNGKEAEKYYLTMKKEDKTSKNRTVEDINEDFVKRFLNDTDEILLACGSGISEDLYQKYLKTLNIANKKTWSYAEKNKKGRPRHLSTQSKYNLNKFKCFIKNPQKNYLIIKEDDGHFFVESK